MALSTQISPALVGGLAVLLLAGCASIPGTAAPGWRDMVRDHPVTGQSLRLHDTGRWTHGKFWLYTVKRPGSTDIGVVIQRPGGLSLSEASLLRNADTSSSETIGPGYALLYGFTTDPHARVARIGRRHARIREGAFAIVLATPRARGHLALVNSRGQVIERPRA